MNEFAGKICRCGSDRIEIEFPDAEYVIGYCKACGTSFGKDWLVEDLVPSGLRSFCKRAAEKVSEVEKGRNRD